MKSKKHATENLVRGYMRTTFINSASDVVTLQARKHRERYDIPVGKASCLHTLPELLTRTCGSAGSSKIVVSEARSNILSKKSARRMYTLPGIQNALHQYNATQTRLGTGVQPVNLGLLADKQLCKVTRIKRATLDGRKWAVSDVHCEFASPNVNQGGRDRGQRRTGRENDLRSNRTIAKVVAMYWIELEDQELLLLQVQRRKTVEQDTYGHVFTTVPFPSAQNAETCIVHTDLRYMVKIVPHYTDSDKLMAVRMWPARSNAADLAMDSEPVNLV
jgi:hypothetical protein